MSLSTPALVLQSLIVILDLFDEIQRNGKLSPEALEQKIEQGKALRKALVAEAQGGQELGKPVASASEVLTSEDAPISEDEASSRSTPSTESADQ